MGTLQNISIALFRKFLESQGLKIIRKKGGHERWAKSGLGRSIVLQSHVDPVPEFIIRSNLRTMGLTVKEFISFVERKS